ncbi:MAG: hypothetical protein ACYS0E_22580 [Planctomycetota bacterium]|jgi:hypothetical protein
MNRVRVETACLLLIGLLAACGEEKKPDKPAASNALIESVGALAPADAQIIVQFASADAARDLVAAAGTAAAFPGAQDPLGMLAMSMGINTSNIDRSRAAAVALTLRKDAPAPQAVFILPFADAAAATKSHTGGKAIRGGYAALTTDAELPKAGSTLAKGLLAGDISIRANCKSIVALYRDVIEQGFAAFDAQMKQAAAQAGTNQPDLTGIFDAYGAAGRNLIFGTDTIDLALRRAKGGAVAIDAVLAATPGGPLDFQDMEASKLASLAKNLPGDLPLAMLMRFDWANYMKLFDSMFDSMVNAAPEAKRPAMREYIQRMNASMEKLGKNFALSIGLGKSGMRAVMAIDSADPAGYIAEYAALVANPVVGDFGMIFTSTGVKEISGAKVSRFRFTMDMEKYLAAAGVDESLPGIDKAGLEKMIAVVLGADGLTLDMVAIEDRVIFVMGGDDAMTGRAITGGDGPVALEGAFARVPGELQLAIACDVRELVRQVSAMMSAIEGSGLSVAAGDPVPFLLAASVEERKLHAGITLNLGELTELFGR